MRRGLERVAAVYGLVERMLGGEARVAAGRAAEVRARVEAEWRERVWERGRGREALAAGDGEGWAMAEAGGELARLRGGKLREVAMRLEEVAEGARVAHAASRVRVEQVQRVMQRQAEAATVVEGRKAQREMDDRFAGRARVKAS